MIIDGESYVNVTSEALVQKLYLMMDKQPWPQSLQWLGEEGEMRVNR